MKAQGGLTSPIALDKDIVLIIKNAGKNKPIDLCFSLKTQTMEVLASSLKKMTPELLR